MKRSHRFLVLGLLSAVSLGAYLLVSWWVYDLGFPLDDAWIHQTYARNLARYGEWAFVVSSPSAGSTAPLWSALLTIGHVVRLGPYGWTYLLGWLSLWGLAAAGERVLQRIRRIDQPDRMMSPRLLWGGMLITVEWHLVWAAGSGMETLPFTLIVLAAFAWMLASHETRWGKDLQWFILGGLVGLSVWLRPDGITLLGAAALMALLKRAWWGSRLRIATLLFVGFGLIFLPYLLFNKHLSGAWWPNTFYAKQAEYVAHRYLPFWSRFGGQLSLSLVGVGSVLLPGFLYYLYRVARLRRWEMLLPPLWAFVYLGMYAWRLPVTYQHGRYIMPVLPILYLWGLAGLLMWLQPNAAIWWRRIVSRAWCLAAAIVALSFFGLGARAYALDVAVIQSEMVATARWVAENTEVDSVVAAHDIGALGFFGERKLLDLAGLVSPEVIPFIRDEHALESYLDRQEANYLVTFPEWYPALTLRAEIIFQTSAPFSPSLGGENMTVYRWSSR